MALVENCFCCSLAIGCGFLAIYLLIAYLIAFAFELLWVLESTSVLPTAAIFLCAGYFTLALFSAILVHGLATKNTFCLVSWMFAITILTFPEAGLVIYMSIQYWRIETLYGMTELACWLARIIASVLGLVAIQSLYTVWKEEELVDKRLRDLSMTAVTIPRDASLSSLGAHMYQNNAYDSSMEHINNLKRANSMPLLWNPAVPNNLSPYIMDGYQFCTTQSEFNASVFMPKYIPDGAHDLAGHCRFRYHLYKLGRADNSECRLCLEDDETMEHVVCSCPAGDGISVAVFGTPKLHLRHLEQQSLERMLRFAKELSLEAKKAQSLMDLRILEDHPVIESKISNNYPPWMGHTIVQQERAVHPGYTLSLNRRNQPKMSKFSSLDDLNDDSKNSHIIKHRTGFYAQPIENYGVPIYYGPLDGPDFLIYKKQVDKFNSKNSLSNTSTDDVQKYRDVAL